MTPLKSLWASVLITAAYPVAGKFAAGSVSPSAILLLGTLGASLFMLPLLIKEGTLPLLFKRDLLFKFSIVGLFGTALPFLLIFTALNYTTPANSAILNQVEAIYSLLLAAIFLKERPSFKQLIGTALLLIGVTLLLLVEGFSIKLKGDLIVIFTVWMFQVSHITAKKLPSNLTDNVVNAARVTYGFFWILPICLILALLKAPFYCEISVKSIAVLFFIAFFINVAGNILWYKAIRNMDLSKATAVMMTYPVFTYILSVIMGFDTFKVSQILGLVLAVGGAYMVTNTIRKENKK